MYASDATAMVFHINPENVYENVFEILRKPKSKPTFLEDLNLEMKPLDFVKIKARKDEEEKKYMKNLEKMAKGRAKHRQLLRVFSKKFEELTGNKFNFQKERVRSYDYGNKDKKTKHIPSDSKRLGVLFNQLSEKTTDLVLIAAMLEYMMEQWSNWEKATPYNLIGFLETQSGQELGTIYMKCKKRYGDKPILNEAKRVSDVDKQRQLFKKGA